LILTMNQVLVSRTLLSSQINRTGGVTWHDCRSAISGEPYRRAR
jgi:hypothetical protein